jgi:hypothetical protein
MSSSKKGTKSKGSNKKPEPITHVLFVQIQRELPESSIIDTINGNVGLIDFKKTHGLFEETLLTAALNADLEKVAARILELGPELLDINHVNNSGETAFLLACKKSYKDIALTIAALKPKCVPDAESYTALMYTCANTKMIDVTKYIITHDICDIGHVNENGETALSLTLEVGNPAALTLLLDSGKSKPERIDSKTGVNLFIKTLLEEDTKTARLILEKTGLKCDPLAITENNNITALMLCIPGRADAKSEDWIALIHALLSLAVETKNKDYVDAASNHGPSAFDLIFIYAEDSGNSIDARIVKPFLDYYYKHDLNSPVFLRNIDLMCRDLPLYRSILRMYPGKVLKKIVKRACSGVAPAVASMNRSTRKSKSSSRSPELQTARRVRTTRSTSKNIRTALEIPIVHATTPVDPTDTGFNVDDPREPGLRMRKRRTMRVHR